MPEISPYVASNVDFLSRRFEQIAHNLANVNTAGFKRFTCDFMQSLQTQLDQGVPLPSAQIEATGGIDFSQGHLTCTGRPLDLAIVGSGFFMLETPSGPLYTRNGAFQLNQNGQLVDSQGRLVSGEGGPILIPAGVGLDQLRISSDGSVFGGQSRIGRLRIIDFGQQQHLLQPAGQSCFAAPADLAGENAQGASVKQGFLEAANVHMVKELVDMLTISRLYEANMRFLVANRDASRSIIDVAMG